VHLRFWVVVAQAGLPREQVAQQQVLVLEVLVAVPQMLVVLPLVGMVLQDL
jgi:hypothetical protein